VFVSPENRRKCPPSGNQVATTSRGRDSVAPAWALAWRRRSGGDPQRAITRWSQPPVVGSSGRPAFTAQVTIGALDRCLDHVVVLSERHLRRLLRAYRAYYTSSALRLCVSEPASRDSSEAPCCRRKLSLSRCALARNGAASRDRLDQPLVRLRVGDGAPARDGQRPDDLVFKDQRSRQRREGREPRHRLGHDRRHADGGHPGAIAPGRLRRSAAGLQPVLRRPAAIPLTVRMMISRCPWASGPSGSARARSRRSVSTWR
jgi:hypothetical protein